MEILADNDKAFRLRDFRLVSFYKGESMEGITEYKTSQGVHVCRLHYTADEDKRSPEWKANAKIGTSDQDWEREYEINPNAPRGKPWYPEFRYDFHVAKAPIQPIEGRPIFRLWDYGLTPATSFAQTTAKGQMVILYPELQSEDCGITAHGKVVQSESATWFPGFQFNDIGDPAGNQRAQTDEKSCNDILKDLYDIKVRPGVVSFTARDEALRKLLTSTTQDGQPMFLIDPRCSQWIIAGFRGGYQRKEVAGVYTDDPDKNMFSHIMDTIQYGAASIFKGSDRQPFVNRAQGGHANGSELRDRLNGGYRRGYQR